jgi:hypothetical protein
MLVEWGHSPPSRSAETIGLSPDPRDLSKNPARARGDLGSIHFTWLLTPRLTLNPRSLIVDLAVLRAREGDRAERRGTTLRLGEDEVLLEGADRWDPEWRVAENRGPRRALPRPPTPLGAPVAGVIACLRPCKRLTAIDLAPLIGLGAGSTPEGDDLLLGLRAAWHVRASGGEAVPLAELDELLRAAHDRTHPVSACMLSDGAAGRYPEALARLLDALCGHGALQPALDELRGLGASSGRAMEWGVFIGQQD